MKNFSIAVLIGLSIISNLSQSDQNTKQTNPTRQDISALREAAERGDAKAQLEYGKAINEKARYQDPNFRTQIEEARNWIQKAANQGLGEAWFWLGYAGIGKKESETFYYEKAAENGYTEAFGYLFDRLLFRAGSAADVAKAKKFGDLARKQNVKLDWTAFETIDRCFEAGAPSIPESDQPSFEEKKYFQESKTDCLLLQTGIAAPQDWNKYRKCLLSQTEDDYDNNSIAEIYANGWGVKRNAKLALALVCHGSSVPAELKAMVNTLYSTKDQDRLQTKFTFCDHVTSGMNGGFCAARAEKIASQKRDDELSGLIPKWTEAQQSSFRSLRKIADDYFREHALSELDMSGTARAQIAIDETATLREELLRSIKSFEAGHLPKESDFARADKDLNEVYSNIMKKDKIDHFGTVTKKGVKDTQRKWVKYRDAWVKFAGLKYPNTAPEIWKTWLTKKRIWQLNEFSQSNP
jgi:TPR repeat protein/uncharacterized protein YecT (DUF1311 family)